MCAECDRQREGAAQARKDSLYRVFGSSTVLDLAREQVRDHFGVGVAFQRTAFAAQFGAQFLVILDDAVVDDGEVFGRMRMGVGLVRCAMRRPAGVRDPNFTRCGLPLQLFDQIGKLAFGAAADQVSIVDGADAGAVIAAIFHPLEAVDKPIRDRAVADDTDDSAHGRKGPEFTKFEISLALA
jgi:hypothetical protein